MASQRNPRWPPFCHKTAFIFSYVFKFHTLMQNEILLKKKEAWRCVTLVCLHHKILIYYKNIAKWRPSWISLGGRKSWTNRPIPINLIFLSLSQHAAKNDTKYDYTFLKMEKNFFTKCFKRPCLVLSMYVEFPILVFYQRVWMVTRLKLLFIEAVPKNI